MVCFLSSKTVQFLASYMGLSKHKATQRIFKACKNFMLPLKLMLYKYTKCLENPRHFVLLSECDLRIPAAFFAGQGSPARAVDG